MYLMQSASGKWESASRKFKNEIKVSHSIQLYSQKQEIDTETGKIENWLNL